MLERKSQPTILWVQVLGLAAVQGSIVLAWLVYNLYLPRFLAQFGFPGEWTIGLLITENLLAVALEPSFGALADRSQRWVGTRFPYIAVGMVLSAALFLCLPAIVFLGASLTSVRWVLPTAAIAWALAMTVFRSPALALLGRYANPTKLPQAASVLTLVSATVAAIAPVSNQFILSLGPLPAFAIGSIVLLLAATVLRLTDQRVAPAVVEEAPTQPIAFANLVLVFAIGVAIPLGFGLVRSLLSLSGIISLFLVANILLALPAGWLARKLGNRKAMLWGLGGVGILLGVFSLTANTPLVSGVVVLLSGAMSLIVNGSLPFALSMVPPAKAGLGIGMYLGGAALASSLLRLLQLTTLPPPTIALVTTIALLVATACLSLSTKRVA
ncbi:MAG TPA: MFS transporter [Thermosynechococcaceae cyanobacterium]